MIKRIVKMTFRPGAVNDFLDIFDESKTSIRAFDGCKHLELLSGVDKPEILFTYSYWESESALNAYRRSELFRKTWKKTKALFAAKAEAWSVKVVECL